MLLRSTLTWRRPTDSNDERMSARDSQTLRETCPPEATRTHVLVFVLVTDDPRISGVRLGGSRRASVGVWVVVMGQHEASVGDTTDRLDQPDRVGHVVEHAGCKYEVEPIIGCLEVFTEVTEQEP